MKEKIVSDLNIINDILGTLHENDVTYKRAYEILDIVLNIVQGYQEADEYDTLEDSYNHKSNEMLFILLFPVRRHIVCILSDQLFSEKQ